jgi:hypothetical protein
VLYTKLGGKKHCARSKKARLYKSFIQETQGGIGSGVTFHGIEDDD